MCDICKARDFYNEPDHQAALNMMFNGTDMSEHVMKDFAFVILYREGMKVGMNVKQSATCDSHKALIGMVAEFSKMKGKDND